MANPKMSAPANVARGWSLTDFSRVDVNVPPTSRLCSAASPARSSVPPVSSAMRRGGSHPFDGVICRVSDRVGDLSLIRYFPVLSHLPSL
jgi:hypothetical protein